MTDKKTSTKTSMKSYRQLRSELDEIMNNLHVSALDVDTAIAEYEKGMKIIKELEAHLKKAELKIQKVTDTYK